MHVRLQLEGVVPFHGKAIAESDKSKVGYQEDNCHEMAVTTRKKGKCHNAEEENHVQGELVAEGRDPVVISRGQHANESHCNKPEERPIGEVSDGASGVLPDHGEGVEELPEVRKHRENDHSSQLVIVESRINRVLGLENQEESRSALCCS